LISLPLLIGGAARARAGEYTPGAPVEFASLAPAPMAPAPVRRGALTAYGYGAQGAPASGPVLDLRGAGPARGRQEPAHLATAPAPIAYAAGPMDIRPPMGAPTLDTPALDTLPAAAAAAPAAPPAGAYLVQIGAFAQKANADSTSARCAPVGAVLVDILARPAGALYRVRLGPLASREQAEAARSALSGLGFADARITRAE
jgi:rare lipoprotein A